METKNITRLLIASMLLIGLSPTQIAWGFETLFTSPTERDQLDQMRYKTVSPQHPLELIAPTKKITLNGLVHRSGGEHTVWVNGMEVERWGSKHEHFKVHHGNINQKNVPLFIKKANRNIRLQPGQTANLADGQVSDLLPGAHFSD